MTSSKIQLVIRGFEKQNIASATEIASLVKTLPISHYASLKSIVFMSARELSAMHIPVESSCKGAFYPEFRSILIHDLKDRTMYKHILFHEIGHYVFHRVIGSVLKKKWMQDVTQGSGYVTDYAKTNGAEDFAECYALFAVGAPSLKSNNLKYQFFRNNVFRSNVFKST